MGNRIMRLRKRRRRRRDDYRGAFLRVRLVHKWILAFYSAIGLATAFRLFLNLFPVAGR